MSVAKYTSVLYLENVSRGDKTEVARNKGGGGHELGIRPTVLSDLCNKAQ